MTVFRAAFAKAIGIMRTGMARTLSRAVPPAVVPATGPAWTAATLDDFVIAVDRAGGPGTPACDALWQTYRIEIATEIDQSLDPFGEAYVAQQLALYAELAGHPYRAADDEMSHFDIDAQVRAPHPSPERMPGAVAVHIQRLARAFALAAPKPGDSLIDFGCGWGLSSELAAYLGLRVRAVDINPDFVALVNARAAKGGRSIAATVSAFEDFRSEIPADLILFYECFHHAVRPWVALDAVAKALRPGGTLILAGEPINDIWWRHWGLRLDALSVYCIRKYGWFESGWSEPFLLEVIRRAGLAPVTHPSPDPEIGPIVIATKPDQPMLTGAAIAAANGLAADGDGLVLVGTGRIAIDVPAGTAAIRFRVVSHRPQPLPARFSINGTTLFAGALDGRETIIDHADPPARIDLSFTIDGWVPDREIGNGDVRTIGAHLQSVAFVPA